MNRRSNQLGMKVQRRSFLGSISSRFWHVLIHNHINVFRNGDEIDFQFIYYRFLSIRDYYIYIQILMINLINDRSLLSP